MLEVIVFDAYEIGAPMVSRPFPAPQNDSPMIPMRWESRRVARHCFAGLALRMYGGRNMSNRDGGKGIVVEQPGVALLEEHADTRPQVLYLLST